ncbi:MAG: enoyl-CoA hydratase/isomerase family protein [Desulfovibrionaceae bacterium]|jgi:enoyl-CoA hydratase/carnithine racemase|nr:enoyl-CoA hydratase/isomerase family protein [Desulfovibrionaceae bacterium]
MTPSPVLFETLPTASGHLFGHATLNTPANLNALSLAMVDLLDPQLTAWSRDERIAGVLLDAAGDKAFCAGGDVVSLAREIRALHATQPGAVLASASDFFEREYRLDYRIHTFPKPLLVWGHGIVMGGGIGLMAGASHRVVTPKTRLAMPEIGIGLYPDVAGSWFLPRLPGRAGAFLALTGAPLNAADALFAGMADFALRAGDRAALLQAIGNAHWQGEAGADGARLSHLIESLAAGGVELPASPLRTHLDRINAVIGHDRLADLAPRLAALAGDADPWLAQAGATFAGGSPTSAALALEMQRRCRHASLADALRLEYQASVGCCAHADFAEGVRALLIDKDKAPRWQPATLVELTPAWIDAHLKPRFAGAHPLADLN